MIRALIVADDGAVLAALTATLSQLERVQIAAYASGRAPVDRVVGAVAPDVVLVDEMCWSGFALARIAEARAVDPLAAIVGIAHRADADWILDGLRAGASAVVPRDLPPETFWQLLRETLAAQRTACEPAAREPAARAAA
jgi:DNA-binding NarL/FixJ family response regulator